MNKPRIALLSLTAIFLFMMACSFPVFRGIATDAPLQLDGTPSEGTLVVMQTQQAFETLAAQATSFALGTPIVTSAPSNEGTQGSDNASPTPTATSYYSTQSPFASLTPRGTGVYPSLTPMPNFVPSAPPTLTSVPSGSNSNCNVAQFVADVSVPDGTVFWPNEYFTKAWRIKNIGNCTWTSDYAITFVDGDQMSGPSEVPLNVTVLPGEVVDIVLGGFRAPDPNPGKSFSTTVYEGYWKLRSNNWQYFGVGSGGTGALTANIKVQPKPTFSGTIAYNLVANPCKATWSTRVSTNLYCTGVPSFSSSIIYRDLTPVLEGNRQENEPALVMMPNGSSDGYVQGFYPFAGGNSYTAQAGDHFVAWVGCMNNATACDVTFRLKFAERKDASTYNKAIELWSKSKSYTGEPLFVDVDLGSKIAGKQGGLILQVYNNGTSSGNRVFWLSPVVKRMGTPALSLTKTPSSNFYSAAGTTITYTYVVKNTGSITLSTPINIADDKFGTFTCQDTGTLAVNATVTCQKQYTIAAGDLALTSIAHGAYAQSGTTASTKVTATIKNAIEFNKSAIPTSYDAVKPITYTYTITNISGAVVPFTSVIDDKLTPDCGGATEVAANATVICNASYTTTQADLDAGTTITNTAHLSYGGGSSAPVTVNVSAVQNKLMSFTVDSPVEPASYGAEGPITFSFTVKNTGNVTLTGVAVDGGTATPLADTVSCAATLAPGETANCTLDYTVTAADMTAANITYTSKAKATFGATNITATKAITLDNSTLP